MLMCHISGFTVFQNLYYLHIYLQSYPSCILVITLFTQIDNLSWFWYPSQVYQYGIFLLSAVLLFEYMFNICGISKVFINI